MMITSHNFQHPFNERYNASRSIITLIKGGFRMEMLMFFIIAILLDRYGNTLE